MIETELCAYSVDACLVAARCGVTRAELCASPWEGGTTPSAGAIRAARRIAFFKFDTATSYVLAVSLSFISTVE